MTDMLLTLPWYVVEANHGEVTLAEREIALLGWSTWLPFRRVLPSPKAKTPLGRAGYLTPLLGPYLLASFDTSRDEWREILSTPGVAGILGSPESPMRVPAAQFEALARRCPNGVYDPSIGEAPPWQWQQGDEAVVTGGAYQGSAVTFEERRNGNLVFLLPCMGGLIPVDIPPDQVELTLRPPEIGRSAKGHQAARRDRAAARSV